jgi:hypothetical protein
VTSEPVVTRTVLLDWSDDDTLQHLVTETGMTADDVIAASLRLAGAMRWLHTNQHGVRKPVPDPRTEEIA